MSKKTSPVKSVVAKKTTRMGRPPVENPLHPTSVGMTDEMRERLEARAAEFGISRSQIVIAFCEYCLSHNVKVAIKK